MKTLEKSVRVKKNFEDVLALVGDLGAYQKFLVAAALIPSSFITAIIVNCIIFQSLLPSKYWCDPPGRELTNYTQVEWWNLTVPRNKDGEFKQCLLYDFEVLKNATDISMIAKENKTKKCTHNWAYDQSGMRDTLPTSMNLFCEDEIYATYFLSLRSFGSIFGSAFLPIIGDRYTGRKMMFLITCGIHIAPKVFLLAVPFNPTRYVFRFLEGLPFSTDYNIPFVIGLELMKPEKRTLVSCITFEFWTIGMCFAPFISWLIPYWWYNELFLLVISLFLILNWWALPKSPRWLLSKGKVDESVDVLMKIAKVNGKTVKREMLKEELMTVDSLEEEKVDIKEVLKHKRVCFNAIILILYAIIVHIIYFCTVLSVAILPENIFLSFFVVSFSEIPSIIVSTGSLHYLGRRFTAVFTMICTLICTIAAPYCLEERGILLFMVSMIKFFMTQGLNLVYLVPCEVFPTSLRSAGLGMIITFGLAGTFLSTYIVGAPGNEATQYWIMGGIEVVGVALAFLLPETIGLPLPQTFPEANVVGINRPFFKWIHYWNQHKFSDQDLKVKGKLDNQSKS